MLRSDSRSHACGNAGIKDKQDTPEEYQQEYREFRTRGPDGVSCISRVMLVTVGFGEQLSLAPKSPGTGAAALCYAVDATSTTVIGTHDSPETLSQEGCELMPLCCRAASEPLLSGLSRLMPKGLKSLSLLRKHRSIFCDIV